MKMKNLLLAFFCCFFSFQALQAQDDFEGCNTPEPTQAQLDYHNLFEGLMFSFDLNAQPNVIYTIPITAHIARLDNGTGGLTAQQLNDAMAIVNDYYLNAKLQFSICGINYIDDNNYYDYNIGDEYAMTTTHNVPNTINIYFVNGIQGGLYCGYTRIPPSSDVVLMANSCVTSGNTLSHELGHYFSLYHTHGKTNFGTTDELVDGTNCTLAGDDICDTPADPNLYGKVNGSCTYTATETDANGMLYTPNVNNIMSYAPKFCRDEFTQGQYERVLFGYLNHRYYLTPDAGFVASTNNLNATFVNTSMGDGVLSYTWDFGDGNIANELDATHTYAEEGVYTVCLETSDGCGIDISCEDINIEVIPIASCLAADSLELVNLYYDLGGDNWPYSGSWLTAPVSEWLGITLTDDGCGVKEIDLGGTSNQDFGLVGTLVNWNFPNLTHLYLEYNQLSGSVPSFSNLPNLEQLYLQHNQLDGSIAGFSNLPSLEELYLHHNQLSGSIPDFANLPELDYLYLSNNQLSGSISDFANLPSLNRLYLSNNQLSGSIPDFANLPELDYLYLSNNQLSGSIPDFANLPSLSRLHINNNQLSGSIPDFANLPNLRWLQLNNNQLSGSIPDFDNLPYLVYLYLNDNQLSGSIPDFDNLPNLYHLHLNDNQLSGSIPDFAFLSDLYPNFYINNNQFDFSNLEGCFFYLNCTTSSCFHYNPQANIPTYQNGNTLYVEAGGVLSNNTYVWYKDGVEIATIAGDNTFTTTESGAYYCRVSNEIVTKSNINQWLVLQSEEVTFIPNTNCLTFDSLELVSLYNTLGGVDWANNTGWLTASVSDWHGITLTADGCGIKEIDLSGTSSQDFGLVGSLTDWNLPSLTHLRLEHNQLSDSIPDFVNLPNLSVLSLASNQLADSIPNFTSLPNLTELQLQHNQLNGNIPNFNNISNLTLLNLTNNQLSGGIPDFSNLLSLTNLSLNNNQLSGNITNFTNLNDLEVLWLQNNQFTFAGLENNVANLNITCSSIYEPCLRYSPQATIPIYQNETNLSVSAGGTLNNNTYTWYKDGIEIETIAAGSTFVPNQIGTYYCIVSNSMITNPNETHQNLVLQSEAILIETAINCNPPYDDFLGEDIVVCDFPITLYANHDNMSYYVWSTNENTQSISISEGGVYSLAIIDECGNTGFDDIFVEEMSDSAVWPGDADNNGEVNNIDVLAIGFMHSETGAARDSIDTTFEGKCAIDWTDELPSNANAKHTDCDGNGVVENVDVQAILDNYGQTHNNSNPNLDANGVVINLSQNLFLAPTPENNQTFILDISANASLYGLAYTLDYVDSAICNFVSIDFSGSCLGTEGIDFVKVVKNDATNNKVYIGVSRLDRTDASCGSIAKITMEILDLPADNNLFISIEDGFASLADESISPIPNNSINVLVYDDPMCVSPSSLQAEDLTASSVTLTWNETGAEAYQLAGRKVGGTTKIFPETTMTSRAFSSGLQSSTCYEWTVRAKCDGIWKSWHTPLASFCTGAAKNGQAYSVENDPFISKKIEHSALKNVVLYPNPAKETAFIALESGFENMVEISVFDILGKTVKTQKSGLQAGKNALILNIENLETGTYFVEIKNDFEKKVIKLNIF